MFLQKQLQIEPFPPCKSRTTAINVRYVYNNKKGIRLGIGIKRFQS